VNQFPTQIFHPNSYGSQSQLKNGGFTWDRRKVKGGNFIKSPGKRTVEAFLQIHGLQCDGVKKTEGWDQM
jgi:hypothetical protein